MDPNDPKRKLDPMPANASPGEHLPLHPGGDGKPAGESPEAVRPPRRLVRGLEAVEVAAWSSLYRGGEVPSGAPPAGAAAVGPPPGCRAALLELGPAVAVAAAGIDELACNRVQGPDLDRALAGGALDRAIAFYRQAGVRRFFVQVHPGAEAVVPRLEARGFRPHNRWAKLYRGAVPPPEVPTDLRIVTIGPERALEFGRIVHGAFGWRGPVDAWMAGLVGRPGWAHYLALDGDEPVATAGLFIAGEWAWLGPAATTAAHRGRGAQRALLARRIRDALVRGCLHVSVETAEDRPEQPVTSYRNVVRAGFRPAYARPNYLLELDV